MPRDDLTIDLNIKMPPHDGLDPTQILDEWTHRVANLPEEIRFIQDEILSKDTQYAECIRTIEDRDNRIQKWIKVNGNQAHNPREEAYRHTIRQNFDRADLVAAEKIALTQKLQTIYDRHLRFLDMQIKSLYDRGEHGFTGDPDELPSILRPRASHQSAHTNGTSSISATNPITAALNPLANSVNAAASHAGSAASRRGPSLSIPLSSISTPKNGIPPWDGSALSAGSAAARDPGTGPHHHQRGARSMTAGSISGLNTPINTLTRHSSLGPGSPKPAGSAATSGNGTGSRAASVGPRTLIKSGASGTTGVGPGGRRGTPSSVARGSRKQGTPNPGTTAAKSAVNRIKRVPKKKRPLPASTPNSVAAESDLSEIDSGSAADEGVPHVQPASSASRSRRVTPGATSLRDGTPADSRRRTSAEAKGESGANGRASRGGSVTVSTSDPTITTSITLTSSSAPKPKTTTIRDSFDHDPSPSPSLDPNRMAIDPPPHSPSLSSPSDAAAAADDDDEEEDAIIADPDPDIIEDDEAHDDRKYCFCQKVSFGNMVACDNDACPYEWFHWPCVKLDREPNGRWYCPECAKRMRKGGSMADGAGVEGG